MSKGGGNMSITKKNIKNCIKEKGFKMKFVAKSIGMTPEHFGKKIKTPWKFTVEELILIGKTINEDYANFDIGLDM